MSRALARSLEPLLGSLWIFFMVWTAILAGLWVGGDEWIAAIPNSGLCGALTLVARAGDAIWLTLGAAHLYLHLAETEGLARARVIALSIFGLAIAIAWCSVWTGYPLGALFQTQRLGMKLGPVSLGWPLLWFIVVIGGRELAGRVLPRASHTLLAAVTASLAALTDFNLEPVATRLRVFWFWYASGTHLPANPSWRSYATWFVVAGALSWLIRERRLASARQASWNPALVFVTLNVMLLIGNLRLARMGY